MATKADIVVMHQGMKDVIYAADSDEISLAISAINKREKRVYEHIGVVQEHFLGDNTRIIEFRKLFSNWKVIRDEPGDPGTARRHRSQGGLVFSVCSPDLFVRWLGVGAALCVRWR